MWSQNYDPLHSHFWSTFEAALPVVILLAYIASNIFRPHHAAFVSLLIANIIATMIFQMPVSISSIASVFGAVSGFVTIGWIVVNVFFLYRLTIITGSFTQLHDLIENISKDRRIQILLIAFAFGSFFEGATAFGTPVAITGAILIGLGFSPLAASALSLIANTTAVGFAAFGAPELALKTSMGLDPDLMGAMIGRQVSVFSVIIPFWLIFVYAGWRGMLEVFPAILVTGLSFGLSQFVVSNYFNFWSVSMVSSVISLTCLILFLQIWQPARIWRVTAMRHHDPYRDHSEVTADEQYARTNLGMIWKALMPWLVMSAILVVWNVTWFKNLVNEFTALKFAVPGLDQMVIRMPPTVPKPTPETVIFNFTWLTYPGTGILISVLLIGLMSGVNWGKLFSTYLETFKHLRTSIITIMVLFAIGTVTRTAGIDTTLGLAFVNAGTLYPLFATFLGFLGVALTGTVTGSNLMLGNVQKITAEQIGVSPYLLGAAHSSGGVMGKMINAQSIVIASTVTGYTENAGRILRFMFIHAVLLGGMMAFYVFFQAYLFPWMIINAP